MKIWIGCDHAGYPMKLEVLAMLQEQGYTVEDMGCDGSSWQGSCCKSRG